MRSREVGSVSKTTAGWAVGVGAEWALWLSVEFENRNLYVDPGSVSFSTSGVCPVILGCGN